MTGDPESVSLLDQIHQHMRQHMADPDLSTPAIQRITRDRLRKALADAGDDCGVTIGTGHLRLVLDLLDASDAALASAPPAPSTGEGETEKYAQESYDIGKRDGFEEGVQTVAWRVGHDGEYRYSTDPERHCPDAATMIERIGELFDAAKSSPSPVPGDAGDLIEAVAEQLWLDTFGPDGRKDWHGCVREAEEYGPESAAAMQVYQWRARARRFADAIRPWLTQAVAEHPSDERAAWIIRKAAARIEQLHFSEAVRDVLAERRRQVEREGYTYEHDDTHTRGELATAAVCYARLAADPDSYFAPEPCPLDWPWSVLDWNWSDRRGDLVKAGALILAEIERLDRAAAAEHDANSGGPDGRPD